MSGTTTAICDSAKEEWFEGAHCLAAQQTPTGNTHTNQVIDTLSAVTGIVVGMGVAGSGIPANTVVAQNTGAASIQISQAATTSVSSDALTFSGDVCSFALVKTSPTGTYGQGTTNYSNLTGNSDESSGAGYAAGGFAWTAAQLTGIAVTSHTAYGQFSVSPSWTSASFSCTGAITYNTANRKANTTNRSLAVHDFGGTQQVSAGTLTATMPSNDNTHALLRAG